MIFQTEGIVLKSVDYGESHKIVHILTPMQGRVSIMAMGAKKTNSKFAALTQPFIMSEFVLYKKPSSLGRINQSEIISSFGGIREDLLLSAYGMYICDLSDRVVEEMEPVPEMYALVKAILTMINVRSHDPEILTRIFEVKLFDLRGYRPNFEQCMHCCAHDPTYTSYMFSAKLGGFLCKSCRQEDARAIPISPTTAKLLRVFQYIKLEDIGKISIKQQYRQELEAVTQNFIEEHFALQLKSFKFVQSVKSMYDL